MSKLMKVIINVVAFIFFMALVILGQQNVGAAGFGVMLLGVAGILVQLYLYNRKYQ